MKKKTLSMLMILAALILIVPAGMADAKAQPQDIAFDLSGSWSEQGLDPDTGDPIDVDYDAAVILSGKISEKGGGKYLSPLHGTIALEDGPEYKIQVKQIKQSEPLYGDEIIYYYPNSEQPSMVMVLTQGIVEANIEGKKFMGWLQWYSNTAYLPTGDILFETGGSELTLSGIVDGKLVSISLDYVAP